jgi:hypothetical protein
MQTRSLTLVRLGVLSLAAFALGACGGRFVEPRDDVDAGAGAGEGEGEGEGEPARDPFLPQPDTSEGLTNTSADLDALLEHGALEGACDAWALDKTNRRQKLLCGKSMFFYEGFGTIGVPKSLLEFFGNEFPDVSGRAWSGIGLVPDPNHEGLPLGVAPGAPLGTVPTLAFTCASCHFGPLPDGRYSVGAPNHAYDYGEHILAISLPAQSVAPGFDPAEHHAAAIEKAQPYIDALEADRGLRLRLLFDLLPLLGAEQPVFTPEIEGHYAQWLTGTMDFMMAPLPLDDGTHTVSKILSLWGLATPDEARAEGMPNELLAWTGGAESLIEFLDGFVAIGDGAGTDWNHERLSPLHDYILSLRSPENPTPPPSSHVERGRALFASEGCLACHDGPRGMGRQTYPYDEIGTDDAMKAWGDPELDGTFCCDFDGTPTHELKSPRLVGLWSQGRFLHNGAVASIEELLCLAPRTPSSLPAQGSQGHEYGCELSVDDRTALAAFLRSL